MKNFMFTECFCHNFFVGGVATLGMTAFAALNEANVDLSIKAVSASVNAGETAVYQIDFKVAGSQKSISEKLKNSNLEIKLPGDSKYYTLKSNPSDLKIYDVVPLYDTTSNTLKHNFGDVQTGISKRFELELNSVNGITPNETPLEVSAVFASTGITKNAGPATTKVKSDTKTSITKSFNGIDGKPNDFVAVPGDTIRWKIKVSVPNDNVGVAYLKPDTKLVIEDELNEHLQFVKVVMGGQDLNIVPVGQKITVELPVDSIDIQKSGAYLFSKAIVGYAKILSTATNLPVRNTATGTAFIPNSASFKVTNISDAEKSGTATANGEVKIAASVLPITTGYYYPSHNYGPSNVNGGDTDTGTQGSPNPQPTVTDDASLTFRLSYMIDPFQENTIVEGSGIPYAWSNDKVAEKGYKSIELMTKIDDNLIFNGIKMTEPFSLYHSGISSSGFILSTKPLVTATINLKDGTTRESILDWSDFYDPNKVQKNNTFGRSYLGLKDTDEVAGYTIKVTSADGGVLSGEIAFYSYLYTKIKKGYQGTVTVSADRRVVLHDGTVVLKKYQNASDRTGPRTATVAQGGGNKLVVNGSVGLLRKIGSIVTPGDNRLRFEVINDSTSTASLNEKIKGSILLPYGVKIKPEGSRNEKYGFKSNGEVATTGKIIEVIDNYNGTGQQLIRMEWGKDRILKGTSLTFETDVEITTNAPDDLNINAYITSGSTNMTVPSGGIIEADAKDMDGDNDTNENTVLVSAKNSLVSNRDLKIEKFVKGSFESNFSYFGHTLPGSTFEYKLAIV